MNTRVLRFRTSAFDVSRERPNPHNPIPGESLLLWLAEHAAPELQIPAPEPEDWGWYTYVGCNGRKYLLGASASEDDGGGEREWTLQIEKLRSLREKLLGKGKMSQDDQCAAHIARALQTRFTLLEDTP